MVKVKILAGRAQLLGDTVSALPITSHFRRLYPNAQIIFPIAKKCFQGAQLYLNHPDIDQIFIFDGKEGPESKRDWDLIKSCDIVVNPNPEHPDTRYPNEFNIYSESWRMAGLTIEEWDKLTDAEKRPKLYKWWQDEPKLKKTIALWPCAGYGKENKRNPSDHWYKKLIWQIKLLNYNVVVFGHPNDFDLVGLRNFRDLSLFEQIKKSLCYDLILSTDSGSGLIMGAYEANQITLLTDHWGNTNNPYALAPNNPNNYNFFAPNGCDNININEVIEKIKERLE